MNRSGGNFNNSNNSNNSNRRRRRVVNIHRQMNGHTYTPSDHPPVVSTAPWSQTTIRYRPDPKDHMWIKGADVREAFACQLGFADKTGIALPDVHFEFKMQSIAVWLLGEGLLQVQPLDVVANDGSREYARLESFTVKNMYAKVGYVYPITAQNYVVSTKTQVALAYVSSTPVQLEVHLRVLWRGANAASLKLVHVYRPISHPICESTPNIQLDEKTEDDLSLCDLVMS